MHPKSLKWLNDIRECCELILSVTAGRTLQDYEADRFLIAGIERSFEIIGEAVNRLRRSDPQSADQIPNCRDIIAFRNLIVHA